ncbi:MAG: class F sortase [Actinobacteria bacterium]|nr:class F sortase [Actinomycetota bacterium]
MRLGDKTLSRRGAAWWRKAITRPGAFRVLLVIDLFLLADAVGVLAFSRTPAPVNTGQISALGHGGPDSIQPPPVRLDVPTINVHSNLVDLALNADGSLDVPRDFGVAGWFARGVAPGGNGNAVIVGHVDSTRKAAVFYGLRTLKPGASIDVARLDGSSVTFVVDAVHQYAKDAFPTDLVYRSTGKPQLRLVTCGGRFDARHHRYADNIIAFAHLAADPVKSA